ncbi:DUF6461 domain-containing protein [Amycolatopsis balhimycina]|uniref:DUF6461 domain-containing protein n=1 Tax=Amycolatopsis balhimycina TaxID=208443 RepID=UPI000F795763|nr:DUF6461 domain-containing protein [Amycolatopsis balhimycina]
MRYEAFHLSQQANFGIDVLHGIETFAGTDREGHVEDRGPESEQRIQPSACRLATSHPGHCKGEVTEDDFGWLSTSPLGEAACVTMVKTTDVDAVVRGFGGVAGEARTIPSAEAGNDLDGAYAVAVVRRGQYVIAVEVNGFQGSRPEVLRRVSRLGETVSAFWNVEALTRFSYAVDGRVKTAFEAGADSWKTGQPARHVDLYVPSVARRKLFGARAAGVRALAQPRRGSPAPAKGLE